VAHRSRLARFLLIGVVLLIAAALTRSRWLSWLGYALIHNDGPAKAEIAVVLAGDYYGYRIREAAGLVRAGYVPAALISGPCCFYGNYESELAIAFALRQGNAAQCFIPFPNSALSTKDEAAAILPELRRRHIRSFLLVTSDYHSGRAARIFRAAERAMGGGPAMRVVAAPDQYFRADSWWRSRQGQKIAFTEWCKTFATAVGM
jgi:uncharacterized SAM-binding protein YcdF (DUF218 family)